MPHFNTPNDGVWFLSDESITAGWLERLPPDAVEITDEEAAALVAIPEVPFKPTVVSMRQARLALLGAGLLGVVSDTIASMPGVQGEAARIEWEYATEVLRDSPLVLGMPGLTAEQLDALFVAAYAIP